MHSARDRRGLVLGLVFWLFVCLAAVLVRGVRWEETIERAQILLGHVVYPDWHPLYRYSHNAFSIHYYLSAALLWLTSSVAAVSGFRSVLFLLATVLPPFLLASVVERAKPAFAHIAAVFALGGVLTAFGSYYPLFSWPDKFTSGHIGMGTALVGLYLLASGRARGAFFLTGLMPCIHLGQAPVLGLTAAVYFAWRWLDAPQDRGRLLRDAAWGVGGLALSALVWLAIRANSVPPPVGGPVLTEGDPVQLWKMYVFGEDIHRAFARFNPPSHGYIALALALFLGISSGRTARKPEFWLTLYAVIVGVLVLGIAAVESLLGDATPPALVVWMPNRLLNHAAVLALALAVGIASRGRYGGPLAIVLGCAWLALAVGAKQIYPEVRAPHLESVEGVLFLISGAAVAEAGRDNRKLVYLPLALVLALGIWWYHQFGAALLVAGFFVAAAFDKFSAGDVAVRRGVVPGVVGGLLVMLLASQWMTRQWLPVKPFEADVRNYLQANADPRQMLVTPHWEVDWQEKTGFPVLYTYELPQFMTYMPSLVPTTLKIRADIYDMRMGQPWDYGLAAWRIRTHDQWLALAQQYRFAHVLSPKNVPLDLTPVLEGEAYTLYSVKLNDSGK